MAGDGVVGDFAGRLDDAGDRVVLRDERDRIIDVVCYGDAAPWPEAADGGGASLQRICPEAPSYPGASWLGEAPTPLAPEKR